MHSSTYCTRSTVGKSWAEATGTVDTARTDATEAIDTRIDMNRFSLDRLAVARRGPWRGVGASIAHLRAGPIRALAAAILTGSALPALPAPAADYAPLQRLAPGVYVQRGAD